MIEKILNVISDSHQEPLLSSQFPPAIYSNTRSCQKNLEADTSTMKICHNHSTEFFKVEAD